MKNKRKILILVLFIIIIIILLLLNSCVDKKNNNKKTTDSNVVSNTKSNKEVKGVSEETPLEININGLPTTWTNKDVVIKVESNRDDVLYSYDNGNTWVENNEYSVTQNKKFVVYVKTLDNKYQLTQEVEINYIDKKKPSLSVSGVSATEKEIVVEATGKDDNTKTILFSMNGGKYQSSNRFTITKKGTYKFTSKDEAGNISPEIVIEIKDDSFAKKNNNISNSNSNSNNSETVQVPKLYYKPVEIPQTSNSNINDEEEEIITPKVMSALFHKNYTSLDPIELSCVTTDESCSVVAPSISRDGWNLVGWNTDSSKKEAKYLAGDIITLDKEENVFYAITSKTIKIKFHKEGTDNDGVIENNCTIYNKETTCDFIIPTFNKAGAFNISWSKTLGGQPVSYYRSGLSIKINSDLDLYASFRYPINYSDTLYKERSIPIVKSLTVGNSLFEYEEGIPLDKIENHYNFMKEVYSKIPFLFVPGKAFVLDSDTYKDISIAYGVTYAAGHEEYFFIDLQYDSKGYVVRNEVDDNATIHELAHAWDYYYRYKKGSRISDQPDIVSFYNSLTAEKRNNLTRVEWFAGVVTEYYWHYLGMNPNKPSYGGYKANYSEEEKEQLVNLLEKYINISKNGYN